MRENGLLAKNKRRFVVIVASGHCRTVFRYAVGRSLDSRPALAALDAAIATRRPPPGCAHHSDQDIQYVSIA